ncbi:MAG: hypothetical protein LBG80_08600, partial [Bacteroidales bacterium]|nr:hypothetical protein [Bacteroidales bacterium]
MKKVRLLLVAGIISCWIQGVSAQTDTTITENFDGNIVSWTSSPISAWKIDTNCSLSLPNALRGIVPNMPGDSVIFTTQTYDLTGCSFALLRFSHICKVSPMDKVRIEYKISQKGWQSIPVESYKGNASNYNATGFNASSYPEWQAGDSLAMPTQLWWKEETFDVGFEVAGDAGVQFRFIIEHGNTTGTQISYGWLLDNIEVIMAPYSLALPIVEFVEPFIKDSVTFGGPWTINARVKTQTYAPIETPWLKYTATRDGVILGEDSILMTRVKGDSLWKATIPSFMLGTKVVYSVTGRDATGNYASDESNYVVTRPGSGYVEIGNRANASYEYPMNTGYSYSWSKQLYYGTEVTPQSQGGFITKLAWNIYNGDPFGWDYENQKCYMRAVDDVLIPNNVYVDPVAEGATLVWSGSYGTAANVTGWVEITLDQSFRLTPGKNLLIYWLHQNGDYTWGMPSFANSITAANTVAYGFSDYSFAEATSAAYSSVTNRRSDARFYLERNYISNSASVSINIEEQIAVSASSRIPVIAVIKNQGLSDLGTVNVSYSVNGSTPVTKTVTINPALVWGTAIEDTLGYYTPKVEGYDTIAVWVKLPNGQADPTIWDDTAKQIVYGCTDLQISFVKYPEDILYYRDSVEITAEITSFSRAPIPSSVSLFLTIENKGITKYDTLDMVNLSGNLWTATIPAQAYGSTVHYAIKLTDILGNEAIASKEYYIKEIVCTSGEGEYFAIQDQSTSTSPSYPLYLMSYGYSRSMSLYTAEEISDKAIGLINKIALRVSTAGR